jgi:excisionase family DNA binding protein
MAIKILDVDAPPPDQVERVAAEKLSQTLADHLAHGQSLTLTLGGSESDTRQALPATAAKLLVKILSEIAKGNAIALVPVRPELSAQEAAKWLNVSQPHLIKLLEQGAVPFHQVGEHRRIRLADVLAYRRKALEGRRAILAEIVALNQEMGLYD